LLLLFWRVY